MNHDKADCEHCLKHVSKNNLNSHQLTCSKEMDNSNFKCTLCTYSSGYESNLKKHVTEHEKPPREKKEYKCSFCEKTFILRKHLKEHGKNHKPKPVDTFKCDYCEEEFTRKNNLKCHTATIHESQKVNNKIGFGIFLNTENKEENVNTNCFKCDLCSYTYNLPPLGGLF